MKMKLADRVALKVAPKFAEQRIAHRIRAKQLLNVEANAFNDSGAVVQRSETRWRGASQVLRSMVGWAVGLGSGRSDTTKAERERMMARSADAYRNHLVARAAVTRVRTNVVGTGLQMYPTVDAEALGITEQAAEDLNAQISREWALYYDNPSEVDIEATHDGGGLQSLALITAMLGGDCWSLTPFKERQGGMYGLKIQLIDPARVSNPQGEQDSLTLQDGVEIEPTGAPVAVHIRRRHPGDKIFGLLDEWDRRPIFSKSGQRRIFQIWNDKDRIGVTRGVPFLAPILEPLQTLEQYSRAELMAAVISSMFTVFITKKQPDATDERGNPLPVLPNTEKAGDVSSLQMGVGAIMEMGENEEPKFADPSRPNSNYDPFFLSIVRQIGAALEIPLDELLLHYQSSYSAARAAMLQAWRFYSMRRWWLVQQFCQPHYCLWFDEAVARGRIEVSGYADPARRAAYTQAIWIGPARGAMQETDEVTAARARVDGGFSNEQIETAQIMGENWKLVYKQRRSEIRQRRADQMELAPAQGAASAPVQNQNRPTGQQEEPTPTPAPDPDEEDEDQEAK